MNSGLIIEYLSKDTGLAIGMVLSVQPKGIRILTTGKRETTIQERSILVSGPALTVNLNDLDGCLELLQQADRRRVELEPVVHLEELHALLVEEPRIYGLAEMAEYLGAARDDHLQAALLRRLKHDALYFREKKDGWTPIPVAEVQTALEKERSRLAREESDRQLAEELHQLCLSPTTTYSDRVREVLPLIEQIAVWKTEAKVPQRIFDLLEQAGIGWNQKLAQFLIDTGRFQPDENLLLRKHNVPRTFGSEALREAEQLVMTPHSPENRVDLRHLRTWVIDNAETRDRDDGFSIHAELDGSITLWVHIADGAHWISLGSSLNKEASRRGTSIYLPDDKLHMLPPTLSEEHLSLNQGTDRTCLTQRLRFSVDGNLLESEFCESLVHISDAISYAQADVLSANEAEIQLGLRLAELLRLRRRQQGGVILTRPELTVKLRDGEILVERRMGRGDSQEMVAEFMIWANHHAAAWCRERHVPCLYRSQEPPENPPEMPETFDPVLFYRAIRSLRRGAISVEPTLHHGLGVGLYCQVTSPLRRYNDLLLQRQIKAALHGQPTPYSSESLMQTILWAENATGTGEEIMNQRHRYFLLKYLKQKLDRGEERFEATVVDLSQDCTFFNHDTCEFARTRKPTFSVQVGQKLLMRYLAVEPAENQLRYEVLQPLE
ncbi:MAG TPA: RNB domain-containing ribonuclease [Candidatus Ozemobacteraceae bacterium]|nr:RNB domain-containing ribonuclease [Candidatus Ozemobacteraceae bacterium]